MSGKQHHFRSHIAEERIEERWKELGFMSKAEYFRHLLREDLNGDK